jgi:hypothetical protein
MGNFLAHCGYYPVSAKLDAIAKRLQPTTLVAIQGAFANIAANADPTCKDAADSLKASLPSLQNASFRMALYPYFMNAMKVLSGDTCQSGGIADESYEDWLRTQIEQNGRPTFGLEDVQAQCNVIQGNTVAEDEQLAQYIINTAGNLANLQQAKVNKTNLHSVLKCGDLSELAAQQQMFQALPWLHQKVLTSRNVAMVQEIQKATMQEPTKTIMVALGALHYADMSPTLGIPTLLSQAGFVVNRLAASTPLNCQPSTNTFKEKGAEDSGLCLAPPLTKQPASCLDFTAAFAKKISSDKMYGRIRDESGCRICSNSSGACACEIKWSNTTAFEQLCHIPINGTSGQVLDMDLTRNPSSVHTDAVMAQKTIRSITQECYATTCNIAYLQEMALGGWYSRYGNLAEGKVTLRPVGGAATTANANGVGYQAAGAAAPAQAPWSPSISSTWIWIIVVILVSLLVLIAVYLTYKHTRKIKHRRTRKVAMSEQDEGSEAEYGGVSPNSSRGYLEAPSPNSSRMASQMPMLDNQFQQQPGYNAESREMSAAERERWIAEREEQIRLLQQQQAQHAAQHVAAMGAPGSPQGGAAGGLFAIPGLKGYMDRQNAEWDNMRNQQMESFAIPSAGSGTMNMAGAGYGYNPVQPSEPMTAAYGFAPMPSGVQDQFGQMGQPGYPMR